MSRDHSAVADAARGCARLRRLEGELIERALSKRTELQKTRDLKRTKGAMTAPGQERGTADTADFMAAPSLRNAPAEPRRNRCAATSAGPDCIRRHPRAEPRKVVAFIEPRGETFGRDFSGVSRAGMQ